jgi:hypothetical protein
MGKIAALAPPRCKINAEHFLKKAQEVAERLMLLRFFRCTENSLRAYHDDIIVMGVDSVYFMYPVMYANPSAPSDLSWRMRFVWLQHVYWTRLLLISIAERLKDESATTDRLMQNPKDIADIFKVYYGEKTAGAIQQLLTEHLQIGAELITALRDSKTAEAERLKTQWYANADKMAAAFSGINQYYKDDELRDMLYKHLDLTTEEVAKRLAGDYPADIQAFGRVEQEAIMMADYFTSGIYRQFGLY